MTNSVGAVSFESKAVQAPAPTQEAKPGANVAKASPQDTVKISQAGQAASQTQAGAKAAGDFVNDGNTR